MPLALQYRPKTLGETIGQGHVTTILGKLLVRWADDEISLPAGLLFAGNKGSGKTSTARVVAAAVNCEGFSGESIPCGNCSPCIDIAAGNAPYVHELDGASHGSVNDVRQIKDLARLHHSGKTRVIIMDECHALTKEAWAAMLKQLEEPQPNVLYILVTTDFQRVPDTIISRCLLFQFLPITIDHIVSRLRHVCSMEHLEAEDEALRLIAANASGALRDALMSLEQLAIDGSISAERFRQIWPLDQQDYAHRFFYYVVNNNLQEVLQLNRDAIVFARDAGVLVDALTDWLTSVMLNKDAALYKEAPILIGMLWDLRIKMRQTSGNSVSMLDMLWVQMSNFVTGRSELAPKPMVLTAASNGKAPDQALAVDELKSFFD